MRQFALLLPAMASLLVCFFPCPGGSQMESIDDCQQSVKWNDHLLM